MPVGSKLPPIRGKAENIALYLLRSTLFSISLQSSVLALAVVGAKYFSAAIVVVFNLLADLAILALDPRTRM